MEEVKPTLCTICLEVKSSENCRVIEEIFQGLLKTLLFKRAVEVNKSAICKTCYSKVFEAFRFKRICTNTEDSLFPYVNFRNGVPVDIKEIYMKKVNKQELRCISDSHKICRLCLKLVISGFTSVKYLEVDLICKYIPEVNFSSTNDPIICGGCVDSVKTYGSFLRKHFDVRKFENICKEETMEGQFHIKKEEIEIKSEDDYQNTGTLPSIDELPCKAKDDDSPKTQPLETAKYECNICAYRSTTEHNLISHLLTHKKTSEVPRYKCCECDYVTKRKRNLVNHEIKHKDISETQIYKETSEILTYKCCECDYVTKRKRNLVNHEIKHKDISEQKIYKCDTCNFESKHKYIFVKHQKRHESISKVQVFKCNMCNFETKHKSRMVNHQRKCICKSQIYRCDMCEFETKHNRSLVNHQENHIYISNTQKYGCDKCNFESKHEVDLVRHQQIHTFHTYKGHKKCQSAGTVKVNVVSVNIFRKS